MIKAFSLLLKSYTRYPGRKSKQEEFLNSMML